MKVTEIITPLNEDGILKAIGTGLGKLLSSSRSSMIEKAVTDLAQMGRKVLPGDVERYLKSLKDAEVRAAVRRDPQIIKDIAQAANKQRSGGGALNKIATGAKTTGVFAKKSYDLLLNTWIGWGFSKNIASAVYEYYTNMAAAEENVRSGAWTQDNYDYTRQHEMTILMVKMAAALPFTASALGGFLSKTPLLSPISKLLSAVGRPAMGLYFQFLNTDAAKDLLVKAALVSTADIPVLGPIFGSKDELLLGLGTTGTAILDALEKPYYAIVGGEPGKVSGAGAASSGTTTTGAATPAQTIGQTSPQPAAGAAVATSTPPAAEEPETWIDMGNGLSYSSKTHKVIPTSQAPRN